MITVEKALKKSSKTRNLLEGTEKKESNKIFLWIGGLLVAGYVAHRMLKDNNEKISASDT